MKSSLAVLLVLVLTVLTVLCVPLPQGTPPDEQFAKVCCWFMCNFRKTFLQKETQVNEMSIFDVSRHI